MPLDDLVSVIETLQHRIATHRQSLQQNEIRTRTALIDPLLTALGWDVSDPALVTPEYSVEGGWADYALRGVGNQPAAIIEAKRLGTLVENHLGQMVNYCIQEGIAYSGVTDGSHWQLYRTFEPVPLAEKLVLDVNIGNTPAYQCALQLLLLWQPNLSSGKAIPAEEPVLALVPGTKETTATVRKPTDPLPPSSPSSGWVTLPEFNPPGGSPPPQAIRFPDQDEHEIKHWNDILVAVATWLNASGKLTTNDVPVQSSPNTYIVHTQPTHPSGNDFFLHRELPNGSLVVNTHGSAIQMRKNSRTLLEHCGIDPATVELQVEQ